MFDLEIIGPGRELAKGESETAAASAPPLKRLRDSHHAVARLLARGLNPEQVSLQTGYMLARIYGLTMDPTFKELIEFYRRRDDDIAVEVESQFLLVGKDAMQAVHEKILDAADEIPVAILTDIAKVFLDRAGYAPIQRTMNKNVNLNIGERLDAARRRKEVA